MSKVTLDDIFSIVVNTQNTLLSMKDDINRLDKKIDAVEASLNQKIYNTKIELTNLIKAESEKIEEKVGNEINDLCILINDTITPDLNEVRSIAIFLKPHGYVSVREDSQKYKVN